ncbi:amidohydrolase family protein [Ruegeria marina]|uniref:Cytosine deaminase n=1 Tax=Ruegeria marina TaxID=639004 RepID=A0A1G6UQ25_9RHOB|nr:amidohydrolase family protein [Ruegeria marina]SDD42655.1 cytosine deaminase [Ruegeria marina]
MTLAGGKTGRIPGVLVPRAMIAQPGRFGGAPIGDCLSGDLVLRNGRAVALSPSGQAPDCLVMPRLTDPHVHLDKCHSMDRLAGVGGDLDTAIRAQLADKARWDTADIRHRASRGLRELSEAGCATVRSHVDWGDDRDPDRVPLAWEVLGELIATAPQGFTLQRAALTDIVRLADAPYAESCAARIARDKGVLGAFVFDQAERDSGLANAFRAADRYGLALDFHVDEGLSATLDGLERIADAALAARFQGPVLCGHACSLANLGQADTARIADKLARAGISVAALPQTNLYLQGRTTGTPDRRGLTRLHELRAAGVNVVLGADNVRDGFCPIGRHDPLHTLALAVLAAHLDPPFDRHLPMITTGARQALGLAPQTVDGAATGDLLLFDVTSTSELLCGPARPRPLSEHTGCAHDCPAQ